MLRFDWELAGETPISAVVGRGQAHGQWESLAFVIGERAVVLTVSADTDEIIVSLNGSGDVAGWIEVSPLSYAIGRTLGWSWCGTNWRGYHDAFIVAFGGVVPEALEPRVMFLGEASMLSCLELTRVHL